MVIMCIEVQGFTFFLGILASFFGGRGGVTNDALETIKLKRNGEEYLIPL